MLILKGVLQHKIEAEKVGRKVGHIIYIRAHVGTLQKWCYKQAGLGGMGSLYRFWSNPQKGVGAYAHICISRCTYKYKRRSIIKQLKFCKLKLQNTSIPVTRRQGQIVLRAMQYYFSTQSLKNKLCVELIIISIAQPVLTILYSEAVNKEC